MPTTDNSRIVALAVRHFEPYGTADQLAVYFDQDGGIVPSDDVRAASSERGTTSNGVEWFTPNPGEGYFAHLMQRSVWAGGSGDGKSVELYGPDFHVEITIHRGLADEVAAIRPIIIRDSPDLSPFLAKAVGW
ncbi:hypothetical protein Q0812_10410 [Brevundimonas sp. 2R-24]|uniref:Uncharacterized protein n=1 Tax=Peiella sedimenti TaxID=3061083 RepID=A0ABT8SQ71_9CAUL|nr:hypothetical protein [Caulobacteraceae bacterium XZ-24]